MKLGVFSTETITESLVQALGVFGMSSSEDFLGYEKRDVNYILW